NGFSSFSSHSIFSLPVFVVVPLTRTLFSLRTKSALTNYSGLYHQSESWPASEIRSLAFKRFKNEIQFHY
ncbi:unnamed protein product, partial [Hymenolepis diminuta]